MKGVQRLAGFGLGATLACAIVLNARRDPIFVDYLLNTFVNKIPFPQSPHGALPVRRDEGRSDEQHHDVRVRASSARHQHRTVIALSDRSLHLTAVQRLRSAAM